MQKVCMVPNWSLFTGWSEASHCKGPALNLFKNSFQVFFELEITFATTLKRLIYN